MNHWEKNRLVLEKHFPGLEKIISRSEGDFEASCLTGETPEGNALLTIGGTHIHSPRDPVKEARRLAAALETGDGPIVLFGFGLGYLAEAALQKNRPLIIVEKHPSLIRKALELRDLGALLSVRDLIFVAGGRAEGISGPLELFDEPPSFLKTRALIALDPQWYAEAERAAELLFRRKEVNKATLKRFGRRWVRNLGKNRFSIRDLPGIRHLAGAGKGFPAFLAAAGPSLDSMGPLLPAIKRRCILIAVDTSLRFFAASGVEPDFTVTVDPQYWNDRHLDRLGTKGGSLIAESAVYPPTLRQGFTRCFLCSSLFPLGRYIEDRVEGKGVLGAGGSVATSAWDFARFIGSEEIWIAGLDLGFPRLKTHFRGALFEEWALSRADRFMPAETSSIISLMAGNPFSAPAMDGGTLRTDKRLSLYAQWFEKQFNLYPGLTIRSLSPGGLAIPGLAAGTAEEILALPERRDAIDAVLQGLYSGLEKSFFSAKSRTERENRYAAAVAELLAALTRIIELSEAAAQSAEAGRKQTLSAGKRAALLDQLEAVNRTIGSDSVKEAAAFLFPPIEELEKTLSSPESQPLQRHLELSAKLYRALALAAKESRRELEEIP
jgi:hypothetical protein